MKTRIITHDDAQQALSTLSAAKKEKAMIAFVVQETLTRLQHKHADRQKELDVTIELSEATLQAYAEKNKGGWVKKTLHLIGGMLCFKKSPGKLEMPTDKTEEELAVLVEKKFPHYVTRKPFLNKQLIKTNADTLEGKKLLKLTGIKINKDELFRIELDSEAAQTA